MNWLFSRALVAAYSVPSYAGIGSCAPSKWTPIADACYWRGRTMARLNLSRYGMTSLPLTASHGAALLMSFQAAFRAKTSRLPEPAPAWMVSARDCGTTWRASFAKCDPLTHSLKTVQCSLFGDSIESCAIFPQWGLMLDGVCYPLTTPAHRTFENDCGYWPTPTKSGNHNRADLSAKSGDGLITAVKKRTVMSFPTPTAQDAHNNAGPSQALRKSASLNALVGGPLNPQFVEWLMGWPIDWTALKPLVMDRCRVWWHEHGATSMARSMDEGDGP